jgi:ABC-type phosphate/phosphonate transport system permease subunit
MTIQAEEDSRVGAWFDCHYANEADLELSDANEASTALKQMALGGVVLAVVFALSLAVWACGPLAFKGLLHAPNRVSSSFLLPHSPG